MINTDLIAKRKAGVLLSVSSLPGPFGTGVFGEEAKRFADTIKSMGFSYWQVLPLGPLDKGNSPYCGDSAFAGNVLYIDPRGLKALGLVSDSDVDDCYYTGSPHSADYNYAKEKKIRILWKAFYAYQRLSENDPIVNDFSAFRTSHSWLLPYAEYKSLKQVYDGSPWNEWPDEISDDLMPRVEILTEYYCFSQYLFFRQWKEVRDYANSIGVKIIGDMPLYVSYDSADVRSNISDFQIDPLTFRPEKVSGVPPDYFSAEGQLWGNPLYNWDEMEKNGYLWWKSRVKTALELYDVVRIDHFRGLASYWSIPAESKTAKDGAWMTGPGMKLFDALADVPGYSKDRIIAEDLGLFGEDVKELLAGAGVPGMKVIQFAFDENGESANLPHNYEKNTVAYVGTHDNNTILGWLWEATPAERAFALRYCGFKGEDWQTGGYRSASCRAIIETVWRSCAKIAVISLADMCGYGKDCRMNVPGDPEGNWLFRTTTEAVSAIDKDYFKEINSLFGRL